MNKNLFILVSVIVGLIVLGLHGQQESHNLVRADEAEAMQVFTQWQQKHGRQYRQIQEAKYRFNIFFSNYEFIREHNSRHQQGLESVKLKLNKFADLEKNEFVSLYTGLKRREAGVTTQCKGTVDIIDNLPASVDWVSKAVSPVKNQRACGSCWAFSACASLQGLDAIKTGKIVNLSPQQLVDCAGGPYQNQGCDGGYMDKAMMYVIDHGITDELHYKYVAKTQKCDYRPTWKKFSISDCAQVPANKTKALQSAVAKQPVSISVEADSLQFQFYDSGIFDKKCGIEVNHGILLTGYGSQNGKDFWNCKNSWGADWGEQGYIRIVKTDDDGPGKCGIMMENVVPIA